MIFTSARRTLLPVLIGCAITGAMGTACSSSEPAGCNVDTGANCPADANFTAAVPPFVLKEGKSTKFPILLHHGFNASTTNGWSFFQVKQALEADGNFVVLTEVEPFNGVTVRGKDLATQIDRAIVSFCAVNAPKDATCTKTTKVNLIAHSMGGLDARYVISSLGYGDRVASLTTISTPHGGSAVADVALKVVPGKESSAGAVVNALAALWGTTFTQDDLAKNTDIKAAFESLSEKNAPAFAAANPNDARVMYQSYAGISRGIGGPRLAGARSKVLQSCENKVFGDVARADFMAASLLAGAAVVSHFSDEPEDGMVTVANAKWGTFKGCIPADHLDEVGQTKHTKPDNYTAFDQRIFYRVIATDLATRGL